MKIAMLIADGGDGSASIRYFHDPVLAQRVAEDEEFSEDFYMNEGSPEEIEVPDGWSPSFGYDDKYYIGHYGE